jgi:hypothetical protein
MNNATASKRPSLGTGILTVLFGVWVLISPFVLGFAHAPAGLVNNVAVGIAIIVLALAGVRNGLLKAMNVLMGAWLYCSAFILYVPNRDFLWNNLILAGAVILAAVTSEAWSED